jgi:hypothetical protein
MREQFLRDDSVSDANSQSMIQYEDNIFAKLDKQGVDDGISEVSIEKVGKISLQSEPEVP